MDNEFVQRLRNQVESDKTSSYAPATEKDPPEAMRCDPGDELAYLPLALPSIEAGHKGGSLPATAVRDHGHVRRSSSPPRWQRHFPRAQLLALLYRRARCGDQRGCGDQRYGCTQTQRDRRIVPSGSRDHANAARSPANKRPRCARLWSWICSSSVCAPAP